MKPIYLALIAILFCCKQIPEASKAKTGEVKSTEKSAAKPEKMVPSTTENAKDTIRFKQAFEKLPLKKIPVVDTTNFDSFIDLDNIKPLNAQAFSLPKVYKNWYAKGYNYRAISGYRLQLSDQFHTAVITCLNNDSEMESVLINYTLEGDVIDSKMVAYDEIAEGWSRKLSRIGKSYIYLDNIFWSEVKEVTQTTYQFKDNGKIEELATQKLSEEIENYTLITSVLMGLKLEWAQISSEYLLVEELSQATSETLVIIPVIAEEHYDLLRLDTFTLVVNSTSGAITHKLFENYKKNGWQSDAIVLEEVRLDPLVYRLNNDEKVFGVRIKYRTYSQPNPYQEETLDLYVKGNNSLKKVLSSTVYKSTGEVTVSGGCGANFEITERKLAVADTQTNGFFDITIETTKTLRIFSEDENGECNPKETITSSEKKIVTYNGGKYQ